MEQTPTPVRRFQFLSLIDDIVPLVGLTFLGWNPVIILPLYWVENIAVGYYTYKKLMLPDITESGITVSSGDGSKNLVQRAALASFFVMHYGIFTLVHGVFAFTVVPSVIAGSSVDTSPLLWAVPTALITAFVAERIRFVRQITSPELRSKITQENAMGAAYVRIIVLHFSILVGAWIIIGLGLPQGAAIVLILLKMIVEIFKNKVAPMSIRIG